MEKWFGRDLARWYQLNKRNLPWRSESDPYKIWLSEIILQQTQVVQGLAYYLKFENKYPTVRHLAKAPEDEVLKLWQGLGYYSRARNLHAAAKDIVQSQNAVFPADFQRLRSLKGVGDYTAAAIASFAFGLPHAVVDGNVYRVLSRIFGIETPIDTGLAKKQFQQLAQELLDKKNPAVHNQAIMEFGSQYCKPVNPDCNNCIFRNKCYAFKANKVAQLPLKAKKTKIKDRFFNYLVIIDKQHNIWLKKRNARDIWQGLYEFVLFETKKETALAELLTNKEVKTAIGSKPLIVHSSKQYKHVLSHQHLYTVFCVIKVKSFNNKSYEKATLAQLNNFAFPRLIEKFLDDCDLKEIL